MQSRRKSCAACIKAKKRCDVLSLSTLSCHRCQVLNIPCEFAEPSDPSLSYDSATSGHLPLPNFDFSDEYLFSSGDDNHLFDSMMNDVSIAFGPESSRDVIGDTVALDGAWPAISKNVNVPTESSLKLFEKLPQKNLGAVSSATIATSILRGIPDMMRRRATFPPFIHHRCYGSEADNWKVPTSLANAMSISHMFYRRDEQTRPLIWRTISAELQRLRTECASTPRGENELLAAVQSVLVYMLMRIVDGPTDEPDCDTQILAAANVSSPRYLSVMVC